MSFFTRSKPKAKRNAAQQAGIEASPGVSRFVDKHMPKSIKDIWNALPEIQQARLSANAAPFNRSVVEARIPRDFINKAETMPVEPSRLLDNIPGGLRNKLRDAGMEGVAALPFLSDVVLKGKVPSKYIKGAPDYNRVTLPELKQHFQSVKADPKGYAKDVGRAFTDVSHRPSKLLTPPKPSKPKKALRFLDGKPAPSPSPAAARKRIASGKRAKRKPPQPASTKSPDVGTRPAHGLVL
jgi:hypothetical protein